ncbi:MAG: aminotransferase class I/II-fold pyridoxal phosphate-dependent enzyme, partial [Gammaproteobacteria bacterium]|nr:aminotransferase class I/II-fold pyridoxal phosphate-dependent enzyme [Gammaproteobacteria bacterium]
MDFDTLDMARLRGLAGNKWRRYGDEILPAWVADMDFLQAAPIRDFVTRAGATGDLGYPFAGGTQPLPEIFAERAMQRYGWRVDTERVELIIDVVQGLYLGVEMYCEPGEGAIVPTPIYPYFLTAAEENGRRAIANPLVLDGGRYVIDFDSLEACIDDGTRMLMVCNPHNPTGRVFLREELEALADVALRHDLVVIADEIFADVVYEGHRYIPFASLGPEIAERTVTFHSATKAFNLGG